MNRKALAKRLKQCRLDRHLGQNALARKAKVSQATISKIETATRQSPSVDILSRLADALGMTISELLTGDGAVKRRRPQTAA